MNMRPTLRQRFFLAFALLACVGLVGSVLSLINLDVLAKIYQQEQEVIASHEAIHEDRILLLKLIPLLRRFHEAPSEQITQRIAQKAANLGESTQRCTACHRDRPAQIAFAEQFDALNRRMKAFIAEPAADAAAKASSLAELVDFLYLLEQDRMQAETALHAMLDRKREESKTIIHPNIRQQGTVVAMSFMLAMLMAWLLAKTLSRPILSLIKAAKNYDRGKIVSRIDLPRDRDLAPIAQALNDMADVVAKKAREDTQRQLFERTIASQEDERKRVARELHDVLGASLMALLMDIKALCSEKPELSELRDIMELKIQAMTQEIRRMAWDLRPALLDDLGLHAALSRYVEELNKLKDLSIDYQVVGFEGKRSRLPGHCETVLYRVAQEALANVLRHAKAHRASVVLIRREREVALLVEDDGCGFQVEVERKKPASLGLLGMEERISLVGGMLTIDSQPGAGTSVRAQIELLP